MTHKTIAAAFVAAQRGFSPALKTSTNPHFRSKYADLSACVEAVIDALNANGIAMMQHTFEDQAGVTVETVFLHESGETLNSGKLHVPASKQDAQGYGSALTYARRYSLMAACGIAPEDDDGNAASRKPVAPASKPMPPEVKQAAAAIQQPKRSAKPASPAAQATVTGDPAEDDLSYIGAGYKPTQQQLDSVAKAFASIGKDAEAEYGKPFADWTVADVAEAREVFAELRRQASEPAQGQVI